MKAAILILIVNIILSCASVKKNKVEQLHKVTTQSKQQGKESTESNSKSYIRSESNSTNENVHFSIVPEPGKLAEFSFNYEGRLITGSTTAAINFSNQKAETKTKTITKTYTIEKKIRHWLNITKTQIIYRIKIKTKVITVDYPWYFWAILIPLIIITWELLKKYLPINLLKFLKPKTND